ncbi:hypothetical protein AGLY_008364 [Aphis glycines]|uniref:Uncharacterized protein n=1 Tax=Aphis glycines TaxID=307491 RepID=A0A6G0TLM1_APHGL|nr:hypothetical protein AGLY_008364 [Aphis glycines]
MQNQVLTKSIILFYCYSKNNNCKYLKFSPNVYTTEMFDLYENFFLKYKYKDFGRPKKLENLIQVPYELFLFHNSFLLTFIDQFFYEICQNCENFQKKKFNTKFSLILSSSYRENSKHHHRKHFNVTITILNICYYSKIISRRYLKILRSIKFFWPNQNTRKFNTKLLIIFEVQILTKIRQNHEYLQIILPLKYKPPFSSTTGNFILG